MRLEEKQAVEMLTDASPIELYNGPLVKTTS